LLLVAKTTVFTIVFGLCLAKTLLFYMIFSMLEKDARSSFYMAAKIAKIWFKNGPKSISKSIL